jgi:pentatricopeptide repeat protein
VWEGRKVDELRRDNGVRSNGYFWSALVDVYARDGDYRGAESVLDELVDESRAEYEIRRSANPNNRRLGPPVVVPPLSAYTSFYSACYKLVSRSDVHPSIKSDAANRAWSRWKEMRIHSVAPDVMAYGALMRIFAAQVILLHRYRVSITYLRIYIPVDPFTSSLKTLFICLILPPRDGRSRRWICWTRS